MNTAFGQAMIDSIRDGLPRSFMMSPVGQGGMNMPCSPFLNTRPDEDLLLASLDLPENGSVLDFGCGSGRHLKKIREGRPDLHLYGIEMCDLLRAHCQQTISTPSTFVESFEDLEGKQFDLVMIMGNSLGVFGGEPSAVEHLERLICAIQSGGKILIEAGGIPSGRAGYLADQLTISYAGLQDGPFIWARANRQWVETTLQRLGFNVTVEPSQAPMPGGFFAIGTKA